jgi:outer membrane lipoprotein-sorting protein
LSCAALAALGLCLAAPAPAAAAVAPAALTAQDRGDLQRVEQYLNTVKTLAARFDQLSQEGQEARGKVYLSRPGQMRFEYDPPSPVLLVATGKTLIYVDNALKQVTYLPNDSTPAWFLLRDHISLSGDVTVTRFERGPGVLRISVVETAHPGSGSLTMTFADKPLQLKQWVVVDQQSKRTTVVLTDEQYNLALDPNLFTFADPWPRHD